MRAPTETYSPIVAEGDQDRATVDLPNAAARPTPPSTGTGADI